MSDRAFIDALNSTTAGALSTAERDAFISSLEIRTDTRAKALGR